MKKKWGFFMEKNSLVLYEYNKMKKENEKKELITFRKI